MKKLLLMCLWLFLGTISNAQINLGSGTSTTETTVPVPWSHYYGYSYVQQIVAKNEINASASGNITGLKFYAASTLALINSNDITVYIGHTSKTSFSSTLDWIPVSALSQVYTGTVTNTAGVINITFTTPFNYNNVDNLVIAIDESVPSYDTAGPSGEQFYKYNGYPNTTLFYRSDSENPDPAAPTITGTLSSYHSRMTIEGLVGSSFPLCPVITNPVNDSFHVSTAPAITWGAVTGATGYKVSIGTTPYGTDILSNFSTTSTTYTPPPLAYSTVYYVTVLSTNATGDSQSCYTTKFTTAPLPPTNNDCSGATQLSVNAPMACTAGVSGTTVGATSSGITMVSPCSTTANGDDDVWYKFTATAPGHTIILSNVVSQGFNNTVDAYMQVLSGTCGTLASVSCSDPNAMSVIGLTPGNEYFVRVFTVGESTVGSRYINFDICVGTLPAAPANDNCTNAVVLVPSTNSFCSASVAGTTLAAAASGSPMGTCTGTADDDVWYSFVATSATHHIRLSNIVSVGTTTSTSLYLQVLSGSCAGLTSVICDTTPTTPTALTGLTVGNTYYVRVYNSVAGAGNANTFNICIVTPIVPANDNCATAAILTASSTTTCATPTAGTTLGATNSGLAVLPCTGTADDDVWYSFVATSTAHTVTLSNVVSVGTGTSSTSLYLQAFSGVCGTLASIHCDTSSASAAQLTGLTVGNTYFVRVYNSNGAGYANAFEICVTAPPPPPANDNCSTAISLIPSSTGICATPVAGSTASASASTETAPTCSPTGINDDVWYSFVATSTTHLVNVLFSDNAVTTQVYSGACGSLTAVSCYAGTLGNSNLHLTSLAIGDTYYVRVFSTTATVTTASNFTICITTPVVPTNDTCATAIAIAPNGTVTGNNALATDDTLPASTCGDTTPIATYNGVWYTVTSQVNGPVTISSCGSQFDSYLRVYSGDCTTGLTCVDNSDGVGYDDTDASCLDIYDGAKVTFNATAGTTYYVYLSSFAAGQMGYYTLTTSGTLGTYNVIAEKEKVALYPNPFHDVLNISDVKDVASIIITDISGRTVKTIAKPTAELQLGGLTAGMYLVTLKYKDGSVKTMKAIKK